MPAYRVQLRTTQTITLLIDAPDDRAARREANDLTDRPDRAGLIGETIDGPTTATVEPVDLCEWCGREAASLARMHLGTTPGIYQEVCPDCVHCDEEPTS